MTIKARAGADSNAKDMHVFAAFMSDGVVSTGGITVPVKILRDTGSVQSLMLKKVLGDQGDEGRSVLLQGVSGYITAPLMSLRVVIWYLER